MMKTYFPSSLDNNAELDTMGVKQLQSIKMSGLETQVLSDLLKNTFLLMARLLTISKVCLCLSYVTVL